MLSVQMWLKTPVGYNQSVVQMACRPGLFVKAVQARHLSGPGLISGVWRGLK